MNWSVALCVVAALYCATAQDIDGPAISTDGGNLRLTSQGDVVFEVGANGSVSFQSPGGAQMSLQGEKGARGDTGDQGPVGPKGDPGLNGTRGENGLKGTPGRRGPPGPNGTIGPAGPSGAKGSRGRAGPPGQPGTEGRDGVSTNQAGVLTWNQCVFENLNHGRDYGFIASCRLNKLRNETWLRITWNGNMRITRCETCCMRWYFTIDGAECSEPAPIDAVIFQSQNNHILRQTGFTGICRQAGSRNLTAGVHRIQFLVKECPLFGGFVYDAYTGWNSISRIIVEEIQPRSEDFSEVIPTPPPSYVYEPHYCHFFYTTLGFNRERNLGTVLETLFNKMHDHTSLRFTWDVNLRKKSCFNCCSRWWVLIDGDTCTFYERIETTIVSARAFDIFVPTTLTGICFLANDLPIYQGQRHIRVEVGNCIGSGYSNTAAAFSSASRLIVEEIPQSRDPQVVASTYHPQWNHSAISQIPEGGIDDGPLPSTACRITKTLPDSSLRVTFNGNLRITECSNCCMRWFITIDGSECADPAPIDGVLYNSSPDINIHRGTTITGICNQTENGTITGVGTYEAVLNVGMCEGFNESYNAFTGFQGVSNMHIEEMPRSLPSSQLPTDGSFYPNWQQCVAYLDTNATNTTYDTNTTLMDCSFTKQRNDTVLKIAWDGNIALEGCADCCMRWFVNINDEECADPGPIDGSIRQDLTAGRLPVQFDTRRPSTITGICRGTAGGGGLAAGTHNIGLSVGACPTFLDTYNVLTGYNSVSRFIIEEIPDEDPECTKLFP